jgi:uncharacterized protein with PQ loop repeat
MSEKLIVGYIATTLSISGTIPQIIHTCRTKKTADLSIYMIILILFQCVAWVTYAIYDDYNQPLMICDMVVFMQYFYLFIAKIYYGKYLCFKKSTMDNSNNIITVSNSA